MNKLFLFFIALSIFPASSYSDQPEECIAAIGLDRYLHELIELEQSKAFIKPGVSHDFVGLEKDFYNLAVKKLELKRKSEQTDLRSTMGMDGMKNILDSMGTSDEKKYDNTHQATEDVFLAKILACDACSNASPNGVSEKIQKICSE